MPAQFEQERVRLGREVARSRSLPEREWTQDDLADRAGLGRRTIISIETGHKVRDTSLRGVEKAFGWPEGATEQIARGGPNPDDAVTRRRGSALAPIDETEAGAAASDREWNKLVKDTIEGIRNVREYLGDQHAELTLSRLIEAAERRGDHAVADTVRRLRANQV